MCKFVPDVPNTVTYTVPLVINFVSPVSISDWLIFCCGNSILHHKKEMKMIKTQVFLYNTKKMMSRKYMYT